MQLSIRGIFLPVIFALCLTCCLSFEIVCSPAKILTRCESFPHHQLTELLPGTKGIFHIAQMRLIKVRPSPFIDRCLTLLVAQAIEVLVAT